MNNNYDIPGVTTFEYTKIIGLGNIDFGKNIIIDDFVFIYAKTKIKIGNYVHIGSFTSITGGEKFTMEDFSGLSSGVRIFTASEDFQGCGFGNPTLDEKYRNTKRLPVHIGKFCLIGANSVILPGVTVGEGATVGAGSVVTKNLEPWGIYVGNRKIGDRDKLGVLENYNNFLLENRIPTD
ncbi:LPS biosynthesis O-acetyl transferase [Chlorogloeopsis fritschii PCC 6912]|uniref:Chloramphenicol acetyltransferase n=1 Tax=Chlorogloeopsis fritschii PCC 6912 TaxID=211165 RepID=A0A433MYL9_CHLFR|nr:acyltransferase [Chlorogloeopsis fritschii]RUR73469.1 LPS biosynthesis O-acetyl transferase [Chlorogloeopsis fritschii PCC 6912]